MEHINPVPFPPYTPKLGVVALNLGSEPIIPLPVLILNKDLAALAQGGGADVVTKCHMRISVQTLVAGGVGGHESWSSQVPRGSRTSSRSFGKLLGY